MVLRGLRPLETDRALGLGSSRRWLRERLRDEDLDLERLPLDFDRERDQERERDRDLERDLKNHFFINKPELKKENFKTVYLLFSLVMVLDSSLFEKTLQVPVFQIFYLGNSKLTFVSHSTTKTYQGDAGTILITKEQTV